MENINSRIKNLRKESGLNQKEFAKKIGLTQTGVSHIEQNGHNVSDSTIKAICYEFKINEQWLRNGIEPMLVQPDTFSLDAFVKEQGMSETLFCSGCEDTAGCPRLFSWGSGI